MKIKSSKAKGRRLQLLVASLIQEKLNLSPNECHSNRLSKSGEDIWLSSQGRRIFPYSVECKNTEKINIWQALKQAEVNSKGENTPLLVFKRNKGPVYCTLPFETLLNLLSTNLKNANFTQDLPSPNTSECDNSKI